jgi:acetyl esterase/lipase
MDIYLPEKSGGGSGHDISQSPFVLFFHGGLWYSGARGDIDEVCENVIKYSNNTVGCATADYRYSQDLGGGCNSTSLPTYQKQADEVISAFEYLAARPEVDLSRIILAGHSAGGHLAAWLSLNWDDARRCTHPAAFAGVEGIYNVSLWDQYDQDHWKSRFHCPTRQAFGDEVTSAKAWKDGSPTYDAKNKAQPLAPMLLIHSQQDTWVQSMQAVQLFGALQPPLYGSTGHELDTKGKCVKGEHPDVLKGSSATTLATCMVGFLAQAEPEL